MTSVLFIGSKQVGLECLKKVHALAPQTVMAVMTIDDTGDTRSVFAEFQTFTARESLPLVVAPNRRASEEAIRNFAPDLCLVVGWYWLISKETLQRVPRGMLGIHNSLLPRYRGAAPLVWAIMNGDSKVGFSLFSFSEGMDAGDIWGQRTVTVMPEDYVADVLVKLQTETLDLLDELWLRILGNQARPSPQDHSLATYCSARTPEDGGIDWAKPVSEVYNFVRAQSEPYPGAFSFVSGQKMIVWRARPIDVRFHGTPGQVAQLRPDGVYVICGDNRPLLVETVELPGQGKMPATAVLQSLRTRLQPGSAAKVDAAA